ncbi:MAG: DUF402 domain-containing protein [Clostridia bacterium]|nr:DUF402 domain-containing protein [Clostridia bacterium]
MMKKKYLVPETYEYLEYHHSEVTENEEAYVMSLFIKSCKKNIPVDIPGKHHLLLKDNYSVVVYMPKKEKFCITGFYDEHIQIVEWYVDITFENGVDPLGPFFKDLYLDYVIAPDFTYTLLDKDELEDAWLEGIIDEKTFKAAYKITDVVKDNVLLKIDKWDTRLRSYLRK